MKLLESIKNIRAEIETQLVEREDSENVQRRIDSRDAKRLAKGGHKQAAGRKFAGAAVSAQSKAMGAKGTKKSRLEKLSTGYMRRANWTANPDEAHARYKEFADHASTYEGHAANLNDRVDAEHAKGMDKNLSQIHDTHGHLMDKHFLAHQAHLLAAHHARPNSPEEKMHLSDAETSLKAHHKAKKDQADTEDEINKDIHAHMGPGVEAQKAKERKLKQHVKSSPDASTKTPEGAEADKVVDATTHIGGIAKEKAKAATAGAVHNLVKADQYKMNKGNSNREKRLAQLDAKTPEGKPKLHRLPDVSTGPASQGNKALDMTKHNRFFSPEQVKARAARKAKTAAEHDTIKKGHDTIKHSDVKDGVVV
jgi:hypothetical protein